MTMHYIQNDVRIFNFLFGLYSLYIIVLTNYEKSIRKYHENRLWSVTILDLHFVKKIFIFLIIILNFQKNRLGELYLWKQFFFTFFLLMISNTGSCTKFNLVCILRYICICNMQKTVEKTERAIKNRQSSNTGATLGTRHNASQVISKTNQPVLALHAEYT